MKMPRKKSPSSKVRVYFEEYGDYLTITRRELYTGLQGYSISREGDRIVAKRKK